MDAGCGCLAGNGGTNALVSARTTRFLIRGSTTVLPPGEDPPAPPSGACPQRSIRCKVGDGNLTCRLAHPATLSTRFETKHWTPVHRAPVGVHKGLWGCCVCVFLLGMQVTEREACCFDEVHTTVSRCDWAKASDLDGCCGWSPGLQ
jgi:hypothetical protein